MGHLYYNYDNSSRGWPIYERMVTSIGRIIEGDLKSQADDAAFDPLKRHALKVMVHVMRQLADWIGVPLHGPNAAASAAAYVGKDSKTPGPGGSAGPPVSTPAAAASTASAAGAAAPAATPTPHSTAASAAGSSLAIPTGERRLSWQYRLEKQRQKNKLLSHCLRIAKESSIKNVSGYPPFLCAVLLFAHSSYRSLSVWYHQQTDGEAHDSGVA